MCNLLRFSEAALRDRVYFSSGLGWGGFCPQMGRGNGLLVMPDARFWG